MTLVQVVQHEWPQLPTAAPLAVSQTVDAVLDYPREGVYASPNGSLDFLSASNLFMLGGGSDNPSPDGLANAASGSGSMGSVGGGSGVGSRSSSGVWGAQGGCVGPDCYTSARSSSSPHSDAASKHQTGARVRVW